MARKKQRRYPAPTGGQSMATRRRIGGDDEDDDPVALALLARGQQEDPRMAMAMQLLKLQQGQGEDATDRAFKERQQAAQEFYQRAGRDIEERRLTASEKEAADAAIAKDVAEGTRQMERGQDIAHRTERETKEDMEKKIARTEAEKRGKRDLFDTLIREKAILPGTPEYEEELAAVDPEYRARLKKVEGIKREKKYEAGKKTYGEMTPKQKAALEKGGKEAKASIEELGGLEIYQKILEAEKQKQATETPRPDLTPKVSAPPSVAAPPLVAPRPQFGNYGSMVTPPQEAPSYSYATRAPEDMTLPAANVWQHRIPQANEFQTESPKDFAQRVLSTPDYVQGPIETPEEVRNRIESDPRYMSAEQQLLGKLRDWWSTPSTPREAIVTAPSEVTPYQYGIGAQRVPQAAPASTYTSMSGGPSAMPPTIQPEVEPSFIDLIMAKLEDAKQREAMESGRERYPDLGTAALPLRVLPPELLQQPTARPLGY